MLSLSAFLRFSRELDVMHGKQIGTVRSVKIDCLHHFDECTYRNSHRF